MCKWKFSAFSYFFQDDHATALHMVAVFGFDSIATLLIEHGGDLNVKTHNEHTPLHRWEYFFTLLPVTYYVQHCVTFIVVVGGLKQNQNNI